MGCLANTIAFNSEAVGAVEGLRAALRLPNTSGITCCIDSQAVIRGLLGTAPVSSQMAFLVWQRIAETTDTETPRCPGHMGIPGNERADRLCVQAYRLVASNSSPTFARLKARASEARVRREIAWHAAHEPDGFLPGLWGELGYSTRTPKRLSISRATLGRLVQIRTAHGDFEAYHLRFRHADYTARCGCG